MPLACEHVLLQTRREMTVMALNHAYAGPHLYGQCVLTSDNCQDPHCGEGKCPNGRLPSPFKEPSRFAKSERLLSNQAIANSNVD
jgi:hypothetical protein